MFPRKQYNYDDGGNTSFEVPQTPHHRDVWGKVLADAFKELSEDSCTEEIEQIVSAAIKAMAEQKAKLNKNRT